MRKNRKKGLLFSFVLVLLAFCLAQAFAADCVRTNNKTFQGADSNASVDANFNVVTADNIIFRNLNLSNPEGKGTGDAIEFTKSCTNIWVDHYTFGQCDDGALDIKRACDYITVSWCKFACTSETHSHNYANLIGRTDDFPDDRGKLKVTMHHNWHVKQSAAEARASVMTYAGVLP